MSEPFLPEAAQSTVSDDLAEEAWLIAEALERLECDRRAWEAGADGPACDTKTSCASSA
jgi:hypothetical protein